MAQKVPTWSGTILKALLNCTFLTCLEINNKVKTLVNHPSMLIEDNADDGGAGASSFYTERNSGRSTMNGICHTT